MHLAHIRSFVKGLVSLQSLHVVYLKLVSTIFTIFKREIISLLFQTKYIEKKFSLQLFFLPTVSQTFSLSRATMRYPTPWNFSFRINNCMCNWDNACDVAVCPDEFSFFHFHFIHFTISNKYNANIFVLTNWYTDTVWACRRFANLIIKHQ